MRNSNEKAKTFIIRRNNKQILTLSSLSLIWGKCWKGQNYACISALNQKPLVEKNRTQFPHLRRICFACMVPLSKAVVCYLSNRNSPVILYVAARITVKSPLIASVGVFCAPLSLSRSSHGVTIGLFVMCPRFFCMSMKPICLDCCAWWGAYRFSMRSVFHSLSTVMLPAYIFELSINVLREARGVVLFYVGSV